VFTVGAPDIWLRGHIIRAHSLPRAAEFRAEPRNLGFCRGIEPRNWTAELF